jgi:DNA-binding transcriptional ArsR family regulator
MAALADDTRLRIVELLAIRERSVNDLVDRFALSQPAISQHLRVLREAGLVSVRADAQRRYYRLDPRPLRDLDRWLAKYRKFWTRRLDSLESYLAQNPEPSKKRNP